MITTFEDRKPTLEEAQGIVGGYVEMVLLPKDINVQVLVNEEGLLENLPVNQAASELCGQKIVGPVVVLKGDAKWT
tara:strand:+ start:252 stop:479 length:228 start_codon:yes stop_codon:yes gene_type:complete